MALVALCAAAPPVRRRLSRRLHPGDRVHLALGDATGEGVGPTCAGTLVAFIPGPEQAPAAVLRLDTPLATPHARGEYVVLKLRYRDARWGSREVVHVELCDFLPEAKPWSQRRQGRWVESRATYERVRQDAQPRARAG